MEAPSAEFGSGTIGDQHVAAFGGTEMRPTSDVSDQRANVLEVCRASATDTVEGHQCQKAQRQNRKAFDIRRAALISDCILVTKSKKAINAVTLPAMCRTSDCGTESKCVSRLGDTLKAADRINAFCILLFTLVETLVYICTHTIKFSTFKFHEIICLFFRNFRLS